MYLYRSMYVAGLSFFIFLFAGLLPARAAQEQKQQAQTAPATAPTIKAQARLVLVDAIVTDKKGNYISDLKQDEFRVWEDDAEQPIKTFSFSQSAADIKGQPQYTVLFFDNASVTQVDQKKERDTAAKFIEENAAPNHYVAILDYANTVTVAQNFTADAELLKQVVLNDKHASLSTTHDAVRVANMSGQEGAFNAEGDFGTRNLLSGIRSLATKLAAMPGRKSLILLSSGFVLSPRSQLDLMSATDACNKSNVAIYPVALRPLASGATAQSFVAGRYDTSTVGPSHGAQDPSSTVQRPMVGVAQAPGSHVSGQPPSSTLSLEASNGQALNALAISTGGFVIENAGDLLGRMERIAKDQSQYYVLGYTPAAAPQGCHKLRVRVDRPGAVVRARSGYCSLQQADPLSGKPIEKQLEAHASGESAGNVAASMRVPYFYASPNVARVNLAIQIPPGAITLTEKKGKFDGSIDILGLAYAPDGTVALRFSDSVAIEVNSKKEADALTKQPLKYRHQFEAAPGTYDLKVVFSTGGDNFAKMSAPLVIDPYAGKEIAISTVALSKEVHALPPGADVIEASLLQDNVPLVSHGFEFVPSGTNVFKKNDPAAFYVEVYEPGLLGATPPTVGIDVKLIEVKTGAAKLNVSGPVPDVKAGSPVVALGLKLPVETLAPGTYRLELKATDSAGGVTPQRITEFKVE